LTDWTPEDEERERAEDERNAGCVLFGLGCAFDGCLLPLSFSFVLAFVWLLS
jgi:hypothetical protein